MSTPAKRQKRDGANRQHACHDEHVLRVGGPSRCYVGDEKYQRHGANAKGEGHRMHHHGGETPEEPQRNAHACGIAHAQDVRTYHGISKYALVVGTGHSKRCSHGAGQKHARNADGEEHRHGARGLGICDGTGKKRPDR